MMPCTPLLMMAEGVCSAETSSQWITQNPIEVRHVFPPRPLFQQARTEPAPEHDPRRLPRKMTWIRPRGRLPEDPLVHTATLVYASDRGLLGTVAWQPGSRRDRQMSASLDHAMWFHTPPRFEDWLLYASESPVAHSARALIHGSLHRRDGTRVASVAQEGLVRRRDE